jgi:glutamine synthetase
MSATNRFKAVDTAINRKPDHKKQTSGTLSSFFGQNVFTMEKMQESLSKRAYLKVMEAITEGNPIDRETASEVASSMKSWAMNKGATHYTHWFQPLTGSTAEKHDAFLEYDFSSGRYIEIFSGEELAQREPDASSFPSGGLRNTFEARGYTAWDPSSPAFVMDIEHGKTLCIPTIFVSYTGESLDFKSPLLRSGLALEKAAVDVCQYFDKNITKVIPTLGVEQEYFVVDQAFYNSRPDLMMSGRTLLGHSPAKGQQLDDHYFGAIPERIYAFMLDFEEEALKLGIPLKTRHNEVAPSQFECAPIFEELNLAVDHNQLLMDLIDRVAARHKFKALMHEKPYAGINGSGKHNNWSMSTNTGKNLLSPGKTPKNNLQFLAFFVNTIAAVHKHGDLLRAAIGSATNDHRLGANEAPPAIISIFIGSQLTDVLDEIEQKVKKGKLSEDFSTGLRLGIPKIPEIQKDNTDRNRTSPFAFTGNKFEFRAVGSLSNCSSPMTVLNAIVADQLVLFKKDVDALIAKGTKKDEALLTIIRQYIAESKDVRYEGNNYSEAWEKEAAKRGLPNVKNSADALDAMTSDKAIKMFQRTNVFIKDEVKARQEILFEAFAMKLQIESRTLGDLVGNFVIPSAIEYQNTLIENVKGMKDIGLDAKYSKTQVDTIKTISEHIGNIRILSEKMLNARKAANKLEEADEKAKAYQHKVKPFLEEIRYHADKLELLVDDSLWPLPKYREMLFMR